MKRRSFLQALLGAPAVVAMPVVSAAPARTGLSTIDGYVLCHPQIAADPLQEMCAERMKLINEMVANGGMTNIERDGGWPPYDDEGDEDSECPK